MKCNEKALQIEALLTGRHGHECLNGPPRHHTHHHDGEDGNSVARHVHDEEIHGDLLQRAKSYIPAPLHTHKKIKKFYKLYT